LKIEHVAIQVPDPAAMAGWYVEHLGFSVRRRMTEPPHTHFLADSSGQVMIEIYRNPAAPVPDYRGQSPLVYHLALESPDVEADRKRLMAAGATAVSDVDRLAGGDVLAMLRDPWGIPLQLAKRGQPMT
jgi:catechol 2,3-dioxygenase-like lactoylglutathione lyase family enzyme